MTPRRALLPRVVLVAILLVVPAAADAPVDQYEQFVRDPSPTSLKTLRDLHTTLVWQRFILTPLMTAAGARNHCGFTFGAGRVPSVKELLTLVDEEPHTEYDSSQVVTKMIDGQAFPNTPVDQPFWTSSQAPDGKVWGLSFATGTLVELDPGAAAPSAYVRCLK
jgi:Protein of unknown function (DUF1566)